LAVSISNRSRASLRQSRHGSIDAEMIVLDTNVLSEEMRAVPEQTAHAWLQAHDPASLFTTAATEAELLYGVALLSNGKRKTELRLAARRIMSL
jgi:toxin FitB